MGDTICRSDRRAINLEFHSLGKGQHKMWEYVTAKLEKPLQVAASKMGIKLSEIEQKKKEEENKVNKIVNAKGKINDDDLDEEYNIPKEILEQFNKNSKNFFKVRKDIVEQPGEEEEEPINEK